MPNAPAFARDHQVLLLRHSATGTPLRVSLAWLPFELEALNNATGVDLGGVGLRVATPEAHRVEVGRSVALSHGDAA